MNMSDFKKRILIVDDEREICDLLEVYLVNEGYEVYKFYAANGVLEHLEEHEIHMAILDVMLPDMDGFTLCRKIRERYFFPIIMLTAKVESADKINGITMGADDYITKPFQPLELLARVKAQFRRIEIYNQPIHQTVQTEQEEYHVRGLDINATNHICKLYGKTVPLTPTEFEIVLYLCRHLGEAVSTEVLFEQVWGEKYLDSNNTVMTHIARIREKFNENARKPKWIKTVWGIGYKIEES